MRILVVDDEEMIRELVRATLSRDERFELFEAADGATTLQLVRDHDPDLVVLDVRMPGIDGVETCRQIRAEHGADRPAIIMLTALGQEKDLELYLAAGANDYFIKPFSPRALLEHVYGMLDIAA
jgi:two-component system OmpR family response regulator